MKVTITGGTGFVGGRLVAQLLAEGHEVRILGRSAKTGIAPKAEFYLWDAAQGEPPLESLADCDVVVHLAGEPVAQRWSPEIRRRIRSSRVEGTRLLVDALGRMERPSAVLVTASATGFYGDRGDDELTEESQPGGGFLAEVCQAWEAEAERAQKLGIRVVRLRTGVVLGVGGGALRQMLPPFKMFIGGQLGSGRQWMPWIHIDDLTGLIRLAIETPGLKGAVNGTAPNPARNTEFTRVLARTLHRPALFTVPEAALKLLFGDMAEILLGSQRVLPEAARRARYRFQFPDLGPALKNLLG